MKIRAGYAISYDCPQATPMIAILVPVGNSNCGAAQHHSKCYFAVAACAFSSFEIIALRSVFAAFNDFFVFAISSFAPPVSPLYDLTFFRSASCRSGLRPGNQQVKGDETFFQGI